MTLYVHSALGTKYERNEEITADLITGSNAGVIKTRARKAMEQQTERTRQHAEVFTPLWICDKMNSYADEVWFGDKDIFQKDGKPTSQVIFQEENGWKRYVDSRRLEITCGEAPYLVSRYDVETGEMIPIVKRIGILDRKLRVVNENTNTEAEWFRWVERAFQATYGYEFQGDNLLIARVNLLMTFEEYLQDRWQRKPSVEEYRKIAKVIVWNIWQMDGLTGTIPSFIMAYGDEKLTLANFDDYTEDDVFLEVTGITEEDFRFLRDGGEHEDPESGEMEYFEGNLFDEVVFNDSIEEFWKKKQQLANYFDESLEEDIFDYIPPQKTNQIFTPKWVVIKMVDELEANNPGCFDDSDKTFADLYMKSGLYITEIVKRLYRSEAIKAAFPDDKERIRHILQK